MIKIKDEKGNVYTLEYTRKSAEIIENMGFELNSLITKPMTMIPLAFYGAFLKNHKGISKKETDRLFENINAKNQEKLIETLGEMITETYTTLSNGNEEGNVEVEIL